MDHTGYFQLVGGFSPTPLKNITLQGINISHLGKRKIIFKMPFLGDMLVPWRVVKMGIFTSYLCFPSWPWIQIGPQGYDENIDRHETFLLGKSEIGHFEWLYKYII